MKMKIYLSAWIFVLFITVLTPVEASSREDIRNLGDKLTQQAAYLVAQSSFDHFKGWKAVFEVPAPVIESYPLGDPVE